MNERVLPCRYLKQLHERYGLKVWLTEFSCGDHAQGRKTSEHLAFMREVLPLLDAAEYVFRYSWMSARDGSGLRGLVETVNAAVDFDETAAEALLDLGALGLTDHGIDGLFGPAYCVDRTRPANYDVTDALAYTSTGDIPDVNFVDRHVCNVLSIALLEEQGFLVDISERFVEYNNSVIRIHTVDHL